MDGIVVLAVGAVLFGFFMIFLLALAEKKRAKTNPKPEKQLGLLQFEKICVEMAEGMKLEIDELSRSGNALDIFAHNPTPLTGGKFLVHCLYLSPEAPPVSAAEILELSSAIIQDRVSKGIFITTGRFTSDLPAIGELAPIEFVDGEAFLKLAEKYAPAHLVPQE
jgi:hypothetical protein